MFLATTILAFLGLARLQRAQVNRNNEVFAPVLYSESTLHTQTPTPVRTGSIEWPHPQDYQTNYGLNDMVWWYIPVPEGWQVDLDLMFHNISLEDRISVWQVDEEYCNSTACVVNTTALHGNQHVGFLVDHNRITFNVSIVIEFDSSHRSEVILGRLTELADYGIGTGFKIAWMAYPKDSQINYGRRRRTCCAQTSSAEAIHTNAFNCYLNPGLDRTCACSSFLVEIPMNKSSNRQLYVTLQNYAQSGSGDLELRVLIVTGSEGETTYVVSVGDLPHVLRSEHSVKIFASCPWSGEFGITWYELAKDAKIFTDMSGIMLDLTLYHGRWQKGDAQQDGNTIEGHYTDEQRAASPLNASYVNLTSGYMTSFGFPSSYRRSTAEFWKFLVPAGYKMRIFIEYFNLEEGPDHLTLTSFPLNENGRITWSIQHYYKFTGFILQGEYTWSVKNDTAFVFYFFSDNVTELGGFNISYSIYDPHLPYIKLMTLADLYSTTASPPAFTASSGSANHIQTAYWLIPVLLLFVAVSIVGVYHLIRKGHCSRFSQNFQTKFSKFHNEPSVSATVADNVA